MVDFRIVSVKRDIFSPVIFGFLYQTHLSFVTGGGNFIFIFKGTLFGFIAGSVIRLFLYNYRTHPDIRDCCLADEISTVSQELFGCVQFPNADIFDSGDGYRICSIITVKRQISGSIGVNLSSI
jgi:hypothetical protein